jgi:carbohydrate diacid regulator
LLSPDLAQQIASETSEAIGHNVIITDAQAIVIGSGDESRVGTLHEASFEVLESQQSAWHTPEQARALRGVLPGITLPLVIGGEAVGTVGITGSPRQVRRFGLLVRRQTEILLEEAALLRNRLQRERGLESLVSDIGTFDPARADADSIEATARDLGLTLRLTRAPMCVEVTGAWIGPELLRGVRGVFHRPQDIVAGRTATTCAVLMEAERSRTPLEEARRLVDAVQKRFEVRVRVGLGEAAASLAELARGWADATDALALGSRRDPDRAVLDIRDLRVEQALGALSPRGRGRLARGADDLRAHADWPLLRDTVVAWCESGFNLVEAAAALHVHRNTLLYRLGKLERLHGRPWRDHRGMLGLYVACLDDLIRDGEGDP